MRDDMTMTRAQRRAQKQAVADAQAVLDNPAALRFLSRVMERTGCYDDPFATANNSNVAFLKIGEQRVVNDILRQLEAANVRARIILLEQVLRAREELTREREQNDNEGTDDEV